jgi:hypothetical protein
MMTTMMTNVPTARLLSDWDKESARAHHLRLAMCAWHADPVGERTRLIKDIAHEHNAPDPLMTRVYLRVGADLRPAALAFQNLDAYVAAWSDALVGDLRAYKAAAAAYAAAIRAVARAAAPRRAGAIPSH